MKKIYNTPLVEIIAVSAEENIFLAGSAGSDGPASIYDQYTDKDALSNGRLDEWDED